MEYTLSTLVSQFHMKKVFMLSEWSHQNHNWDSTRANSEITHTTTNTQPAFGYVLIKGRTKFEGSKNVPWLIQDKLFQIEFAFNYWNISAYLLKKWIYYYGIIMLRNNSVNYLEFCPTFDKDCLHFQKCDASAPPPWRVPIWPGIHYNKMLR